MPSPTRGFFTIGPKVGCFPPLGIRESDRQVPASLFANPVMKYIRTSAGNIPVDRKASDKRVLFQGTFRTLANGEAVALFPEGTSYTEPHIMQVKDGAAWAALEYTKWAKENPDKVLQGAEEVMIIPAAIVYTNKSKYRSQVSTAEVIIGDRNSDIFTS